jgi:hypothetical protein
MCGATKADCVAIVARPGPAWVIVLGSSTLIMAGLADQVYEQAVRARNAGRKFAEK